MKIQEQKRHGLLLKELVLGGKDRQRNEGGKSVAPFLRLACLDLTFYCQVPLI